jgi:hypothetical protein
MRSMPRCSTATMSAAWCRGAEAGTPPKAAHLLAGAVCVMEMAVRQVLVADHELRPANWYVAWWKWMCVATGCRRREEWILSSSECRSLL